MKSTTVIISKNKKPAIKRSIKKDSFTIVAIGSSAGGLEAITLFKKNISSTTGMAFIFMQHLSPDHKSLLVPLLSKNTKTNVLEVENMAKIEPNNVYIIPYNKEIELFTTKGKITVSVNLVSQDEEKVTIEFTVNDTGIGIPENKISNLFENFEQASAGTSRL